jgi:hypothetical protein
VGATVVGDFVGTVGDKLVGVFVGCNVNGASVGRAVGVFEGRSVGCIVGLIVGLSVGNFDGNLVGYSVGADGVGDTVGACVLSGNINGKNETTTQTTKIITICKTIYEFRTPSRSASSIIAPSCDADELKERSRDVCVLLGGGLDRGRLGYIFF